MSRPRKVIGTRYAGEGYIRMDCGDRVYLIGYSTLHNLGLHPLGPPRDGAQFREALEDLLKVSYAGGVPVGCEDDRPETLPCSVFGCMCGGGEFCLCDGSHTHQTTV